jgi:hypothetical protein
VASPGGKRLHQELPRLRWDWDRALLAEQPVPERLGIAEHVGRDVPEPRVLFREDESASAFLQAIPVAEHDRFADVRNVDLGAPHRASDRSTGPQSDEVVREWELPGFVEIVDPPNEAAFGVTPRAKVLDVEIADREDDGRTKVVEEFVVKLHPPVEGGAEEREGVAPHAVVLADQIRSHEGNLAPDPPLVVLRRCVEALQDSPP